jgi:hypothetical protein
LFSRRRWERLPKNALPATQADGNVSRNARVVAGWMDIGDLDGSYPGLATKNANNNFDAAQRDLGFMA